MRATILGASVWGPGLDGWCASAPILAGAAPYAERALALPPPPLPPAERRRCGPVVRLALAAAHEAALASGVDPARLRTVFASSTGDGPVVGAILEALASGEDRAVSPTQFHNSVHNAAAGYWSIAVGSQRPATCLGCHDDTAAATLMTAMAEWAAGGEPVLLCCYDHRLPPPLDVVRPTGPDFSAALVLGAGRGPTLELRYGEGAAAAQTVPAPLAPLMRQNPAARLLPLLAALARGQAASVELAYLDGRLTLELQP